MDCPMCDAGHEPRVRLNEPRLRLNVLMEDNQIRHLDLSVEMYNHIQALAVELRMLDNQRERAARFKKNRNALRSRTRYVRLRIGPTAPPQSYN